MKRVAARVTGRVQGVFFRDATRRVATGLGLTGWVRNEPDGSVHLEVQGSPEQVDQLVGWLADGPRQARVVRVEVADRDPADDEHDFTIS